MDISRTTLEKQAYVALRERILSGQLPVGRRLLPKDLAVEMNISPTPVKGALAMLEHDGLVVVKDRKHAAVRRLGADEIRHAYAARVLLELEAVRLGCAAGRVDGSFVAGLQALYDAQCEASARGTQEGLAEALRLDREFHQAIVSLSANPVLVDWHRSLMWQTHTLRVYSLHNYEIGRARAEHADLVEAFCVAEPESICVVLRRHLDASRDDLLRRVEVDTPFSPTTTLP